MTHTIENDLLKVTAQDYGAELVSVINKKTNEEMMWQADPSIWEWHGPVLFPYCGKLLNGKYILDGKEYEGAQHGFIRNMTHTFVNANGNTMSFIFNSNNETKKLFPFDFSFETIFTINGKELTHSLKVTNKSNRDMKFGIGFHPAFNFPFDNRHMTNDYELRFEKKQSVVIQENFTEGPYEGYVSGENTLYTSNSETLPLNDRLFDKDSLCLTNLNASTLSIVEKDSGRRVTVNIKDFPYVQLWSMVGTETLQFLAIEPWHSVQDRFDTNQNWNDKPCAATLKPNEVYQTDLRITYDR